jgi:hypothetical protein
VYNIFIDMNNVESFWPSIEKLVSNLLLKPIDGDYDMSLVKYPNSPKYGLHIDVNVNVAKTIESHEEYDSVYSKVIWNLEDAVDTIYNYLGISHEDLDVSLSPNYYNYDFLEDELFSLKNKIVLGLRNNEMTEERIEELDIWTNLYLRDDDTPWYSLEVGTQESPTKEEEELIDSLSYSLLDKTHYSKYAFDEISFWFNY